MSDVFDLDAVREWGDLELPADRDRWPGLMNQIRSDVVACCDYIDELEVRLAALEGVPS